MGSSKQGTLAEREAEWCEPLKETAVEVASEPFR